MTVGMQWATRWVDDWRSNGSAYEVARLLTAPVRHGLINIEVENPERLPEEGPAIVVANHISFFDSVLLLFQLPRPVSVIGKAEYTEQRITNWLFCGAGMIPIRRENPADTARAFEQVGEVLDEGRVVGLFPEGTRSRDGRLHKGHPGAAHLAITRDAPLVPLGIVGTDKLLPTGARVARPFQRVTLRVGEPMLPSELGFTKSTNKARRELTDLAMEQIEALCPQDYVDEYHPLHVDDEEAELVSR